MSELSSPQNLEEVCAYLELCVEEAKDKAWGEGISFALCFIKKLLLSAQSENDWIPVTKKAHPDLPIRVQVQMSNGWIITAYWDETDWFSVPDWDEIGCPIEEDEYHKIKAWRELPEPYEERREE